MDYFTAFFWGIAFTLIVEAVVLMFATNWLRKKVRNDGETERA